LKDDKSGEPNINKKHVNAQPATEKENKEQERIGEERRNA